MPSSTSFFPITVKRPTLKARVVKWQAPGDTPLADIAVVELDEDAPEQAGTSIITDIECYDLDNDSLNVFGVPEGQKLGEHVEAKFNGKPTVAWRQLDATSEGRFIEPGFSATLPRFAVQISRRQPAKKSRAMNAIQIDLQRRSPQASCRFAQGSPCRY